MVAGKPLISALELRAVDDIFDMRGGYVLDFTNRTFSEFFADLDIDIDKEVPEGSKAVRLRAFLLKDRAPRVARALERLLEYRGVRDGDETSRNLRSVKNIIDRLRTASIEVQPLARSTDILSLDYVHELGEKVNHRLASGDLDGAITVARTMLEAVLFALEEQVSGERGDYKGDLPKQFKAVAKLLRIDDARDDLDEHFKQVARGLVHVVSGLAPIRNKMSDGHARQRKPQPHHARVIANAVNTITTFLVESYQFQRAKGRPTAQSLPLPRDPMT